MIRPLTFLIALAAACLMLLPARAQDAAATPEAQAGHGVVRFSLNQSACTGHWCEAIRALIDSRLFAVDPATGALLGADKSDLALIESVPTASPDGSMTLALRQDRFWSDGEPITAYDLLFYLIGSVRSPQSELYYAVQQIAGVRVDDAYTLTLRFGTDAAPAAPTCDLLPRINLRQQPYHTVYPGFRDFAEQHAPAGDFPSLAAWWHAYVNTHLSSGPDKAVTGGRYSVGSLQLGDPTTVYLPMNGIGTPLLNLGELSYSAVDAFVAGDTNLLIDVPVAERAGVRLLADPNRGNVQIAEVPGRESVIIVLNLGNPQRALPGFHPVTGEILDQGTNLLFSDPAVRQALQLAIDQDALIDGVFQRSALPLAGLLPPASWAFDPSLPRPETNLKKAGELLDAAGWIDNGVARVCHGCKSAPEGMQLHFRFGSGNGDSDDNLVTQIVRAWAQIHVTASPTGYDPAALTGQTFDAYLLHVGGDDYEDADPDRTLMLTPAGDILDPTSTLPPQTLNYGSYNNAEVTDLLAQARTLPGCDPAARADIYHRVERILQNDRPFLSVAAPTEFYAAAPGVMGFAPRTGDPFWNVESWSVAP